MSPILAALMTVLDEEHAAAVVEHRRVTIKKPLTVFAAKLLAKEFAKCADPHAAVEEMILGGWRGFKAEWVKPAGQHVAYRQNARSAAAEMNLMLLDGEGSHGRDIDLFAICH